MNLADVQEHIERIERVGCNHPPVYDGAPRVMLAWCNECVGDAALREDNILVRQAAEHVERCKRAGCKHPAFYGELPDVSLGWCLYCREDAYGREAAEYVEQQMGGRL